MGPSQEDTARLAGCAWAKPRKQRGLFISMVFFLKSLMSSMYLTYGILGVIYLHGHGVMLLSPGLGGKGETRL